MSEQPRRRRLSPEEIEQRRIEEVEQEAEESSIREAAGTELGVQRYDSLTGYGQENVQESQQQTVQVPPEQRIYPRSEAIESTVRGQRNISPLAQRRVTLTGTPERGVRLTEVSPFQPTGLEAARELARRARIRSGEVARTVAPAQRLRQLARSVQVRGIRQTYTPGVAITSSPTVFLDKPTTERHPMDGSTEQHGDVFTHPSGMIGQATGDILDGEEVHDVGPSDQPLDEHNEPFEVAGVSSPRSSFDYGPYLVEHDPFEDYDIWTGEHKVKVDHDIRDNYDIYTGFHGQRAKNDKKSFLDIPFPGEVDEIEYEKELDEKRQKAGLPSVKAIVNADYVGGRIVPEPNPPISEPLLERDGHAPQMLPTLPELNPATSAAFERGQNLFETRAERGVPRSLSRTRTIQVPQISPEVPQELTEQARVVAAPTISALEAQAPRAATSTRVPTIAPQDTGLTGEDLPADLKAKIAADGGVGFYRVVGRNYVLKSKIPLRQTELVRTQYGSKSRLKNQLSAIPRAQQTADQVL